MHTEIINLINEVEFKLEALPDSYFIEYFERYFLPKLKDFINKSIYNNENIN
jgi:hypothetical protein